MDQGLNEIVFSYFYVQVLFIDKFTSNTSCTRLNDRWSK